MAAAAAVGLTCLNAVAIPVGTQLQQMFNDMTLAPVAGVSSVNVYTEYVPENLDAVWSITASGGSINTLVYNLSAAYAKNPPFGVYDIRTPSHKVEIFNGAVNALGDQVAISMKADGSVLKNFTDTGYDFFGNVFGYYLKVSDPALTWYSQSYRNSDQGDHLLSYAGQNDTIQLPGMASGTWTPSEFMLAWEDMPMSTSDLNYTDLVVMVESVNPVPEAASTLMLLGLGILGLAATRRNK